MSYGLYIGKNLTYDGHAWLAGYGDEPSVEDCAVPSGQLPWDDLGDMVQSAWKNLGFSGTNWDQEDEDREWPEAFRLHWEQLSDSTRQAAKKLGYSDSLWEQLREKHDDDEDEVVIAGRKRPPLVATGTARIDV